MTHYPQARIILPVVLALLLYAEPIWAIDYMIERQRQVFGIGPLVNVTYTLSLPDPEWPDQITFSMSITRSLLVRIVPLQRSTSMIMLASETISPRSVRPVWGHDDLKEPIVFWTSDFWTPSECDDIGCPIIIFQMRSGAVAVTILEKKENL